MQPKTSVGIALALLARDARGDAREALFSALAPSLRREVQALLAHVEDAPSGSAERAARMRALMPTGETLRVWPSHTRVASIVAAHVDPLAPRPAALPLPRRRYRVPQGLREALLHQAQRMSKDIPWHV